MAVQQTSLDAFESILEELGDRQLQIFDCLKRLKEANNLMISKELNLPINSVTPRIQELRFKGMVVESKKDKCPYTKRSSIFWRINWSFNDEK